MRDTFLVSMLGLSSSLRHERTVLYMLTNRRPRHRRPAKMRRIRQSKTSERVSGVTPTRSDEADGRRLLGAAGGRRGAPTTIF